MQSVTNDGARGKQVFTVRPFMSSNKRLLDENVFNSYEWDSSPIKIEPKYSYSGNKNSGLLVVGAVALIILIFKK